MKIAYIVPSLANKGPVIVVKELVDQMTSNGHECTVFYFDDIQQLSFACSTKRLFQNERINFLEFDIIHSHGIRPDWYVYRYREYSGKVRYLSTVHSYVFQDLSYQYNYFIAQVFGRFWMRWLRKHDKIVTLSMNAMKYYEQWINNDKLTYAYNTRSIDKTKKLSDNELKELLDFKGTDILIGVNALLSPVKGIDILIKALPALPEYKLFIVGDGKSRKSLEQLARIKGVYNRCYFVGVKADAYRYLPYYDIFAMPSRSEGFPLALLEAAFFSKNSVVTDIPIVKEAFTTEEVSMFQLSKPETIVGAILKATNNSDMGEKMYEKYTLCYSPENMYRKYILIYQQKP